MARTGRGGARTPNKPAAVSGPGALSARTDGGPSQPIRVPTGGPYGQATQLADAQRAAPLPAGAPPATGGGVAALSPLPSLAAPTGRPNEPVTAGLEAVPRPMSIPEVDPDALLRLMYQRFPHPQLARLLDG